MKVFQHIIYTKDFLVECTRLTLHFFHWNVAIACLTVSLDLYILIMWHSFAYKLCQLCTSQNTNVYVSEMLHALQPQCGQQHDFTSQIIGAHSCFVNQCDSTCSGVLFTPVFNHCFVNTVILLIHWLNWQFSNMH